MARGIEKLHPELVPICHEFVRRCKAAGLNVLVTETLRTKAEQDAIYAQGRTKPGVIISNAPYPKSPHCWGVAFDFCRNVKGKEYDDSDGFFAACGAIGKALGLTWGGDWKSFRDKPHLELKKYMPGSSTRWLIQTYGTPEAFFKTWTAAEKPEKEKEEDDVVRYKYLKEIPNDCGFRDIVDKLMTAGIIGGDGSDPTGNGDVIDLSHDMVRQLVFEYRGGAFDRRLMAEGLEPVVEAK